jgi:hypothetical protein
LKPSISIFIGDNGNQEVIGVGEIFICFDISHISKVPKMFHVLHLAKNLVLVYKTTWKRSIIEFFHDHCMVKTKTKGQKVIFCCNQVGNLYPIGEPTQINSIVGHNNGVNIIRWHLHIHTMHEMKKRNMISGIQNNFQHLFHKFPFCERYVAGKQHKIPFPQGNNS